MQEVQNILICDGVHPKTSPFYTHYIIWVYYKVLSQLSQLIFLSFSYLNSARQYSVFELCRELKKYGSIVNWITVW